MRSATGADGVLFSTALATAATQLKRLLRQFRFLVGTAADYRTPQGLWHSPPTGPGFIKGCGPPAWSPHSPCLPFGQRTAPFWPTTL